MFKSAEPILHTLRQDIATEGRIPDREVHLYLNKEQVLKEYKKIKEEVQKKRSRLLFGWQGNKRA